MRTIDNTGVRPEPGDHVVCYEIFDPIAGDPAVVRFRNYGKDPDEAAFYARTIINTGKFAWVEVVR